VKQLAPGCRGGGHILGPSFERNRGGGLFRRWLVSVWGKRVLTRWGKKEGQVDFEGGGGGGGSCMFLAYYWDTV